MSRGTTLYRQVVDVTYEYLGPATDRFVTRQIRNHLHKDPEELKKEDLKRLIDWISIAVSLLSNDDELVSQYIASLRGLLVTTKGRSRQRESITNSEG